MGHRVSDISRPRRLAKTLGRHLAAAGHPRTPEQLLDIVARLHFYRDHDELSRDIGKGPRGTDDRAAGEADTVHRRLLQASVLVREGIPSPLAEGIVAALRPTEAGLPAPLARDPVVERLRTPAGVRRALASAGVRAVAGGDLTFVDAAGPFGRWQGIHGTVDRDGRREPFCLAVSEDGARVVASRKPGREPRDLLAGRKEGRRDGFRDDLSATLELLGYLDPPAANPAPDDVDAVRASRILLRLDGDVLSGMRTLPRFSCDAYELLHAMPTAPGGVRALVREVPLLAGFVLDHCEAVSLSVGGTVPDTPLLRLVEGPAGLARGHHRHRAPDPARVERVVSALSGLDPRMGDRMTLAVVRHLSFLPPEAVPVSPAQAEAMFDAVDVLGRFEDAGMRVARIYEGLEGGDWLDYVDRLAAFAPSSDRTTPFFRLLGPADIGSTALSELAGALADGFSHARGLHLSESARTALARAFTKRLAPHVLRNRPLLDYLAVAKAYADARDGAPAEDRPGAEAARRLAAAAPLLPGEWRGRDCESVLVSLDYDPDLLAEVLGTDPAPRFTLEGEPVIKRDAAAQGATA